MRVAVLTGVVLGMFASSPVLASQAVFQAGSATGLERAVLMERTITNARPWVEFETPAPGTYWEVLNGTLNSTSQLANTEAVVLVDEASGAEIFHSVHIFGGGTANVYTSYNSHLPWGVMASERTIIVPPGWRLAVWHVSSAATVPYALRVRLMVVVRLLNERPLMGR